METIALHGLDGELTEVKWTRHNGEPYTVHFASGPLFLRIGHAIDKPGARFQHPSILARRNVVLEFKHYRKAGSKFWTASAGSEFYICIPKEQVQLVKEESYSYPKVIVNGVQVVLNVSGHGGSQDGWHDSVGAVSSTLINMPLRILKALCAVALTPSVAPKMDFPKEDQSARFLELACRKLVGLKPSMKVVLNDTTRLVGTVCEVVPALRKNHLFAKTVDGETYRIGREQIDWTKTANANGIKPEVPAEF